MCIRDRQLKEARADMRIEASLTRARGANAAELLGGVRENPKLLVTNSTREIRSFRIALSVPMGSKRGRGRGAFIDSVLNAIDDFYSETVQHLNCLLYTSPS